MNTLKSAALLVVLLAVLYAVYAALNKPEPPKDASPSAENAPPLIEYGAGDLAVPRTSTAPPPLVSARDEGAASARSVRGGVYQPNHDAGSLPPPTTSPASLDPTTAAASSGLQRSAYEAPAVSPATDASPAAGSQTGSSAALDALSPATAAREAAPALAAYALRRDFSDVQQLVAEGKFRAALAKLTPHYTAANLPPEERAALYQWLDALAAKVIYSREHVLASAHQVRRGETLYDIAQRYNVEYRLLQNINSDVTDPLVLVPATELKVVPGPFAADVNLSSSELTLLVNNLYAGRFAFALGDQPPQPGDYKVIDKRSQQTYVGLDGRMIAANDSSNPYGAWWISLGGEVAIHGSPLSPGGKTLGCISLSPQDAQDVYGILSVGSEVKIRR